MTSLKHGPHGDHFLQLAIWGAGTIAVIRLTVIRLILDYFKTEWRGSEILAPVDVKFYWFFR